MTVTEDFLFDGGEERGMYEYFLPDFVILQEWHHRAYHQVPCITPSVAKICFRQDLLSSRFLSIDKCELHVK